MALELKERERERRQLAWLVSDSAVSFGVEGVDVASNRVSCIDDSGLDRRIGVLVI